MLSSALSAHRMSRGRGSVGWDVGELVGLLAGRAHGGCRNRLEHDEGDGDAAYAAAAVVAGVHPRQGQLDVGEGSSSARSDEGFYFTPCQHRVLVPIGRVIRHWRAGCWLMHLDMSQLFAAEVTLLLQRGAENGETRDEEIASVLGQDAVPGRNSR
jgi:hypothetical protein